MASWPNWSTRIKQEVTGLRDTAGPLRVLAACGAVGVLAGCASGTATGQFTARPTTASPSASTTAAAGNPQTLVRAAYLGMWQAYVTAARIADYQAPGLDHYAAGGALTTLTSGLYQEHQDGDVTLGQPVLHPVTTMVKGSGGNVTQADVTDCADSSHWLNYHDGKPVPSQDVRRRDIIARLQPFNGTWKVTYLNGAGLPYSSPGASGRATRKRGFRVRPVRSAVLSAVRGCSRIRSGGRVARDRPYQWRHSRRRRCYHGVRGGCDGGWGMFWDRE